MTVIRYWFDKIKIFETHPLPPPRRWGEGVG